jgi:hypothetical protein
MRRPKIFTASFEQAQVLLKEENFFDADLREGQNGNKMQPKTAALLLLILFVVMQGIEWMSNHEYHHPEGMSLPRPTVNLLPSGTALIGWLICLFFHVGHRRLFDYDDIKGKSGHIISAIWSIYGTLIMCLWILTGLSGSYYFQLVLYVIVGWIPLSCLLYVSKKRAMEATLFGINDEGNIINKVMDSIFKFFIAFGSALIVLYQVVHLIFHDQVEAFFDVGAELTGFFGMLMVLVLGTVMFVYMIFPTVIHIFYRVKYSEELRECEGKSQIEWYGEKYFNKKIKGTERERP